MTIDAYAKAYLKCVPMYQASEVIRELTLFALRHCIAECQEQQQATWLGVLVGSTGTSLSA